MMRKHNLCVMRWEVARITGVQVGLQGMTSNPTFATSPHRTSTTVGINDDFTKILLSLSAMILPYNSLGPVSKLW
jgi:hypothetical protein